MKAHTWLTFVTSCFFVMLAPASWAQQVSNGEEAEAASQPASSPAPESALLYTSEAAVYRDYDRHQWIANLQKAGFINRALPKPYRVAIPLMSFGDAGPKIMLTYAKNMPGDTGGKGPLLFITVGIP